MRPYRINWVAASTTYLGALQAPTINVPLTFANPLYNANFASGRVNGPIAAMPQDNVRTISLTSTSNLSAMNFTFTGVNEQGLALTEVLAGPNNNTVYSKNAYFKIFSIVPSSTSVSTVSIGIGGGYTMPYRHDYYNLESLISYEISNVPTGNPVSLLPQITNDLGEVTVGQTIIPAAQTWFTMPIDQTAVTTPIVGNVMFSFREFPVAYSRFLSSDGNTSTFTSSTLQQGGHY